MIGYVTIGVSDMEKACAFYDGLFAELGGKQMFGQDRIKFYGTGPGQPMVAICIPYDEQAQHPGNGNMLALPVKKTISRVSMTRLLNLARQMRARPVSDCRFSTAPTSEIQTAIKSVLK